LEKGCKLQGEKKDVRIISKKWGFLKSGLTDIGSVKKDNIESGVGKAFVCKKNVLKKKLVNLRELEKVHKKGCGGGLGGGFKVLTPGVIWSTNRTLRGGGAGCNLRRRLGAWGIKVKGETNKRTEKEIVCA